MKTTAKEVLDRMHRADVARKLNPLRRTVWAVLGLVGALLATTAVAAAAPVVQETATETTRIWPVLLPILTASVAVERTVELIWNYIDWGFLNFRDMKPSDLKSPQYLQFKSGTSLLLGVVFGILVANYMSMRVFAHFEPLTDDFLSDVPSTWDIIVTGIIIGAGSKPAHDILGILTKFKEFLDKSAIRQRELAGAAFADGMLKLSESETQAMVDVPGAGPTPMGMPLPPDAEQLEGADADALAVQERNAQILRDRTAM
jgi:hypothetical protein